MKSPNRRKTILIVLSLTTMILTILDSFRVDIWICLGIASIPAIIYSILTGIKDYKKFF